MSNAREYVDLSYGNKDVCDKCGDVGAFFAVKFSVMRRQFRPLLCMFCVKTFAAFNDEYCHREIKPDPVPENITDRVAIPEQNRDVCLEKEIMTAHINKYKQ